MKTGGPAGKSLAERLVLFYGNYVSRLQALNSQVYEYVFILCFQFKLNVVQILTRILACSTLHILFDSPRMFRLTEVERVSLFLVL